MIFLTGRRSTIIEKEAEGPDRRANRLDTEIRSPEVEGEADYTWRSGGRGRGPRSQRPVNLEDTTRSDHLGRRPPNSCGHRPTDRPTNRFLLGINSFGTPAAPAVNTLSQVNFKRRVLDPGLRTMHAEHRPRWPGSQGSLARL